MYYNVNRPCVTPCVLFFCCVSAKPRAIKHLNNFRNHVYFKTSSYTRKTTKTYEPTIDRTTNYTSEFLAFMLYTKNDTTQFNVNFIDK